MSRQQLPSKLSGIGINYYHESMGYISRTDAQINADLDKILHLTNRIKVYHNPYTNAGAIDAPTSLAICKNITTLAKAKGFYVVWNENRDSGQFTAANWSDYSDKAIADALEANGVGADEFLVGNEISIHNDSSDDYNDTNLPIKIKQLVTDCASNFSGIKGYQEGWWKKDAWNTAGLGSLSKIYFTLYEAQNNFKVYAQDIFNKFGNNSVIGEFSTATSFTNEGSNEEKWARQIANRIQILKDIGLNNAFYFDFKDGNGGFGITETGDEVNFRLAWQSLFSQRQWFYV